MRVSGSAGPWKWRPWVSGHSPQIPVVDPAIGCTAERQQFDEWVSGSDAKALLELLLPLAAPGYRQNGFEGEENWFLARYGKEK